MSNIDLIIISQSEIVNFEKYSSLPVDRIELYKQLIYPRMLHYGDGFRSQMDMVNYFQEGTFYSDADYEQRRQLLNVWNLPGFSGMHLANYLLNYGIETRLINFFDSEWD